MSTLITLRDAIVSRVTTAFPLFRVEPHGGRFAADEIPLWLAHAPCLLVAPLGVEGFNAAGLSRRHVVTQWAVYLFITDQRNVTRGDSALITVNELLSLTFGNHWGLDDCREPEGIQAQNLYTGYTDKLRISLWVVNWTQILSFHEELK